MKACPMVILNKSRVQIFINFIHSFTYSTLIEHLLRLSKSFSLIDSVCTHVGVCIHMQVYRV